MNIVPATQWEVPAHTCTEFAPRKSDYAICVSIINEGDKFKAQLKEMAPLRDVLDIIIADGGSTDGSTDLDFLRQNHVNTLLVKTGSGKLSAQMRMALAYCIKRGYKGIITVDGNNKDDVLQATRFIEALEAGYDHIQGSRFIPGGVARNTPLSRLLGIHLIHAPLISLSAGFRYTDSTNGFKAYSARLLLDERVSPFREVFSGYELQYYLSIRSARLGYRVKEVPVTRVYPKSGKVPTKISPVKGNLQVMKTLLKAVFHHYDPK